jgi:5'-nucleotidase
MKRKFAVACATLFLSFGCSISAAFELTLAHLNDTHSHLEPISATLKIDGVKTTAEVGGVARLKTLLDKMRADDSSLLLLHAGDAVQGTLYFTEFGGDVEFDFLNMLGVDAFTLGNHEFDRGTDPIPGWIRRSRFPWISANIDFSAEPSISPLVRPYLIKEINGERVAIIGVTTETTPQLTKNVGQAVFNDPAVCAEKQVKALLTLGINKIILLSHLGYQQDRKLAGQIAGIDIIVGGHSHTFLGRQADLAVFGLVPEGSYPTEVLAPDGRRVLVLQAGKWGMEIGLLKAAFTPEGEISGYTARTTIPVGASFYRDGAEVKPGSDVYRAILSTLEKSKTAVIANDDSAVAAALAPKRAALEKLRREVVAAAVDDIEIGLNSGPGPLAAESMLAALPGAQLALLNHGGVRRGLRGDTISVGDVLEVMPFASTLVLVDLTGAELKQALEDSIDYTIVRHGAGADAMPYIGNAKMTVRPTAAKDSRIASLTIMDKDGLYRPAAPEKVYRTVVNSFTAGGGDSFSVIKKASGFRIDTGIIDSDAFRDYLKNLGRVTNPSERRITVAP